LHLAALPYDRGEVEDANRDVAGVLRLDPLYCLWMAKNFYLSVESNRKAGPSMPVIMILFVVAIAFALMAFICSTAFERCRCNWDSARY
jgi:hypothetical protein